MASANDPVFPRDAPKPLVCPGISNLFAALSCQRAAAVVAAERYLYSAFALHRPAPPRLASLAQL